MDEAMRQAYARLTVHEFMLEIVLAQLWAGDHPADAEQARANILRLMRKAYVAPDGDVEDADEALAMLGDANVIAERFLDKVVSRAADIRAQRARLGG